MEREFLVIIETATQKETFDWWGDRFKNSIKCYAFDTFDRAKTYMRGKITEAFEGVGDDFFDHLFGEDNEEDVEKYKEFDLFPIFKKAIGVAKLKAMTRSLITDPSFVPDEIAIVKDVSQDYCAYVSDETSVHAMQQYFHKIEYNIHRMEQEDGYYYFEAAHFEGDEIDKIYSIKLTHAEKAEIS